MRFNIVSGLPRSGSTLLCNILNQNPNFYASSTSILPGIVSQAINNWSNSDELKSLLINEKEKAVENLRRICRLICQNWHLSNKPIIFDKSRGWTANLLLLRELFPKSKAIITIRHPLNIIASTEKQHRKSGIVLNGGAIPLKERIEGLIGKGGMVTTSMVGTLDIIHRKVSNVLFIKCEDLTADPKITMIKIYNYLEEKYFDHNFDNIENVATDTDELYLNKYPHSGSGKIRKSNDLEWREFISDNLAKEIMSHPIIGEFTQTFDYGKTGCIPIWDR